MKVTSTDPAYQLKTIRVSYGTMEHLSNLVYNWSYAVGIENPDIIQNLSPLASTYTIQIPVSSVSDCFNLNVHATLTDGQNAANDIGMWIIPQNMINSYAWSSYYQYCLQSCPPPPGGDCGQLRTQTPGGWGAVPQGNNPGTYLHANFSQAFPQGLAIGCYPAANYIRFTYAQAITDLLPTGGMAKVLTHNYLNPSNPAQIKNKLVSHMVALTLSVGFDTFDSNFGTAGMPLGNMLINSGTFQNWRVADFLAVANRVLGGCSTSYSIQSILETATAINENYVDGNTNGGYLICLPAIN